MKNIGYILAGLALSLAAASCKPTLDAPAPDTGSLNFSRYVAVGDYTTAGFLNGGISRESQQTAYPNILAQQFAASGGPATFEQPYFSNAGTPMISLTLGDARIPVLSNTEELLNFILAGCGTNKLPVFSDQYSTSSGQTASLQNLGVPGLNMRQMSLKGLGNNANVNQPNTGSGAPYNPYFDRLLPAGDNHSYRNIVSNSKPTFFTMWVGMADVVQFAMSGGTCGTPPTFGQFSTELTTLLDSMLVDGNTKGVICNIPSVQYLGFPKSLTLQAQYQQQRNNPDLKIWVRARKIYNAPSLGYDTIQITDADFITVKGLQRLGKDEQVTVNGSTKTLPHGFDKLNPLIDEEALDRQEAEFLEASISIGRGVSNPSYNSFINTLVTGSKSQYKGKLALANMQELYGSLKNGINYNGVVYSLTPVSGGFYSYDFFTPTPRGQAIIANKIIRTMNEQFDTRIFEVNVNSFKTFQHQ